MVKLSANQQVKQLFDYLEEAFKGGKRNYFFGSVRSASPVIKRLTLKSVAQLAKVLPEGDETANARALEVTAGNIMVARTTSFLTAEEADTALNMLDQLRDTITG